MYYFITDDLGYVCSVVFSSVKSASDFARALFFYDSFSDTSVFRIHCFNGCAIFPSVADVFKDGKVIRNNEVF